MAASLVSRSGVCRRSIWPNCTRSPISFFHRTPGASENSVSVRSPLPLLQLQICLQRATNPESTNGFVENHTSWFCRLFK